MRDVAIIGAGSTKFGELWGQSFRSLGIEAGMKAMASAGLSGEEIEAIYIGNMSSRFIKQQHIDALVADYTGMAGKHVASTSIEAGGASGGVAFRQGVMAVASGMHDVVIVGGAEKMTDLDDDSVNEVMNGTSDADWEAGMKAMASAGLSGEEIEAIYIGNMSSRFIKQQHIDALVADYTGMAGKHVASTSIEAGGASGGVAFRQGVMAVAS
jgi:acetyl-CoA acetyltransferase